MNFDKLNFDGSKTDLGLSEEEIKMVADLSDEEKARLAKTKEISIDALDNIENALYEKGWFNMISQKQKLARLQKESSVHPSVNPKLRQQHQNIQNKERNIERFAPVGGALLGAAGLGAIAPKSRRGAAIGGALGGLAGKITSPLVSEQLTSKDREQLQLDTNRAFRQGNLFRG